MDGFVAEPDVEPIPLRNTGKPPKPPPQCEECGKPVTRGCVRCRECYNAGRRVNNYRCGIDGCRCKARRNGMCCTHYYKKLGEDKVAARIEKHRITSAKYREKAHAIATYRQQVPKQRMVE